MKYQWKKAYKGPFKQGEALGIAEDLRKVADPEKNGMLKIAIRKRSLKNLFDVMVKTEKDEN